MIAQKVYEIVFCGLKSGDGDHSKGRRFHLSVGLRDQADFLSIWRNHIFIS
jgi:hypothetical protein